MPKFLIGSLDGKIRSVHDAPLKFSVSGRYVVDVPQEFVVEAPTDSLTDLIDAKVLAFRTQIPGRFFPFALYDELIDMSMTDLALSYRYFAGRDKRAALFPGGTFITDPMSVGVTISQVYGHWNGFILYSDPGAQPPDPIPEQPAPPRLLFDYDSSLPGFIEFNPNDFSVYLLDNGSQTTVTNTVSDTLIQVASVAGFPSLTTAGPDFDIFVTDFVGNDFVLTVDVASYNIGAPLDLPVYSGGSSVATGNTVWWRLQDLVQNAVHLVDYGPGNVRLRFRNVSTGIRHLSDWILMHDSVA